MTHDAIVETEYGERYRAGEVDKSGGQWSVWEWLSEGNG